MRKSILCAALALCSCIGVSGQVVYKSVPRTTPDTSEKAMPELIGLADQMAPSFVAAKMDGSEFALNSTRGKVVVMNLWGTFCPPCLSELPALNALRSEERRVGKECRS